MTTCSRADAGAGSHYPFLTLKERDNETGLDYFLARYYSSTQGRFTSPDEFSGGPQELYEFVEAASENPTFYAELTNPQSLNKYQYTYNNPLRYTDPTGHCVGVLGRLLCTPAGQRAIERGGQRVIERATPYVAVVVGVLGAATEWARSGNTDGDPWCRGCQPMLRGAQQRMAQQQNILNKNNSGDQNNQGNSNQQPSSNDSGSTQRTPHGEKRKQEGQEGNSNRQVGDPNRTVREGRKFRDTDTGNDVFVRGNRVVVVDPNTGKQVTQFKNSRANTQKRIDSGRWEPQ